MQNKMLATYERIASIRKKCTTRKSLREWPWQQIRTWRWR